MSRYSAYFSDVDLYGETEEDYLEYKEMEEEYEYDSKNIIKDYYLEDYNF